MSDKYISIVGTSKYFGMKPLAVNNIVTLIKDKSNDYDHEAIAAEMPMIGKVGYVANNSAYMALGTLSAGRIYDLFDTEIEARVVFTTQTKAICELMMPSVIADTLTKMYEYNDKKREPLEHILKVFAYCALIADGENIEVGTWKNLGTVALVHDIGIKSAMEKYGDASGKHQETQGEPLARELLNRMNFNAKDVQKIAGIVGSHHTYDNIRGTEHQILAEADLLVNMRDANYDTEKIKTIYTDIFKTKTGKMLLQKLFME